jgi:membrane protein implicated in regulation of membrane protease activity
MDWTARLSSARSRREYRPAELVALGGFAFALLPGLALTVLSPGAWPIPVVALVGLLTVLLAGGRRLASSGREQDRRVTAEASSGIAQLESWLAQRHHT